MPPAYTIHVLSRKRDRSALETFVGDYVDRAASEDRGDEDLMMLPLGMTTDEAEISDDWEWEPSRSLSHVLERGLDLPHRAFAVYGLKPADEEFDSACIAFTQTGEVVFALSLEDLDTREATLRRAQEVLDRLMVQFDGEVGWVDDEQPAPLDEEDIRAVLGARRRSETLTRPPEGLPPAFYEGPTHLSNETT